MKNLILSAACGLDPNQIEFFLKSLRKYYNEDVLFLVGKKDLEVKQFLKNYNCNFLEIKEHKFDVQLKRYFYYLKILKEKKYKNILLCDSRDIYFQSNPFDYPFKGSINFFLESKKIIDCPYNTNWIIKTYGQNIYNKLSNNIITCSGTTLGTHEGIKSYLELMIDQAKNYKYKKRLKYFLTFRRDKEGRGCDQAHANYIAHNNLVDKSYFYENNNGPIATVFNLEKIIFNEKFQLINSQNKPYAVVHQYDKRWEEFKDSLKEFKKNLI